MQTVRYKRPIWAAVMLEVQNINVSYGDVRILFDLSIDVAEGEIHCLLGRNGAGKTTTLKAIMGLLPLISGSIRLNGELISSLPSHEVPKRLVGLVPQGRRLFSELTVAENLAIGTMVRNSGTKGRDSALELFPVLRQRLDQIAATLSGGEQQMLATARALCIEPRLLLLDEPTEGLQPSMIELIRRVVSRLRDDGVAILLVEQRIDAVLSLADQVTFIENGRVMETTSGTQIRNTPQKLKKYLGV